MNWLFKARPRINKASWDSGSEIGSKCVGQFFHANFWPFGEVIYMAFYSKLVTRYIKRINILEFIGSIFSWIYRYFEASNGITLKIGTNDEFDGT